MILNIIKYPNPLLRKKAKKVKKVDKKIKDLIKNMFDTVKNAPGVGLAAPQVGESLQIIVVNHEENQFALINPKIKKKSKEIQIFQEGCLSVPGLIGIVERPEKIEVEALDKNGEKIKIEAEGFIAVIIQHEMDHLDGKLFIDRVKDKNLIREVEPKKETEEELI